MYNNYIHIMRLNFTFSYSLVFVFSLLVPLQCAILTEDISADIINTTCEKCGRNVSSDFSYDFCYASLAAVPLSHVTDLGGLGLIALELALENATTTVSTISSLLQKNESNPCCENCLESCFELYVEMSIKLDECISEFVSGKKHEAVYLWISEIMQATNMCEESFKEWGYKSPLTKENHDLSQLCGIVLCIIDQIGIDQKTWS